MQKICFLGFGEAARAFADTWAGPVLDRTFGFDLKSLKGDTQIRDAFRSHGVTECLSSKEATQDADVILSLVTADQTTVAAQSIQHMKAGALYLDCNSVSPGTKRENSNIVHQKGADYVDVAVMAPVYPLQNKVPLFLSGPKAQQAASVLTDLGLNPRVLSTEIGKASAVKMIRSIMIKGLEALSAECMLAGVQAGVDDLVLETLEASFPGFNWAEKTGYNLERMTRHGARRAAEMDEVTKTVAELGVSPRMAAATADWQRSMAELDLITDQRAYKEACEKILSKLP